MWQKRPYFLRIERQEWYVFYLRFFWSFLILLQDSFADFVHDFVGMSSTSGVHSLASLRSDHTANEGGQIKFHAGCSDINGISLAKSFGNDHFVLLRSKKNNC